MNNPRKGAHKVTGWDNNQTHIKLLKILTENREKKLEIYIGAIFLVLLVICAYIFKQYF